MTACLLAGTALARPVPTAALDRLAEKSAQQSAMSELMAVPGARIHAVFERQGVSEACCSTTYGSTSASVCLGGGRYAASCDARNSAIKAAIDNLRSVGIATVTAAGNCGWRNDMSTPACVTSVGGVASYSIITPFVSLLAPGASASFVTP